ncbi:hypothetical protein COLO4_02087 [Corchorus olitorius]|uniref:Uncharacterized protein n=1 Tax=Corchorus olitorius TaxID=93759 RepID=A0A1R3L1H7_9ROSI|nr:hypothetical protein COLO4_02087 [Corchorus olitorius]
MVVIAGKLQRVAMALVDAAQNLRRDTDANPGQHTKHNDAADGGEKRHVLLRAHANLFDEQARRCQLIAGIQQHRGQAGERNRVKQSAEPQATNQQQHAVQQNRQFGLGTHADVDRTAHNHRGNGHRTEQAGGQVTDALREHLFIR